MDTIEKLEADLAAAEARQAATSNIPTEQVRIRGVIFDIQQALAEARQQAARRAE